MPRVQNYYVNYNVNLTTIPLHSVPLQTLMIVRVILVMQPEHLLVSIPLVITLVFARMVIKQLMMPIPVKVTMQSICIFLDGISVYIVFCCIHFADIDECDENLALCNSSTSTHCANTDGDYTCYCKTGYQPSMDGHSCEGA